MKYKSRSLNFLQQLARYIENHFNTTIKDVRSDNARELCEGNAFRWYIDKGITHQTSCAHTPQQNGVIEGKHHHLIETVVLFLSKQIYPLYFGVLSFSVLPILSIVFPWRGSTTSPLMKNCFVIP